jgi:glycine hydroxymethyltransferase
MYDTSLTLTDFDPELAEAVLREERRQEDHVELIASENHASPAGAGGIQHRAHQQVRRGLPGQALLRRLRTRRRGRAPGHRARQGAVRRDYANVQPHSGAQANGAVYLAMLEAGDTVLGMSLAHGGHLTHGAAVNFSGKTYKPRASTAWTRPPVIDYDEVARLALEHKPRMIMTGFSAYSRILDWARSSAR